MTESGPQYRWADAQLAASLFAIAPEDFAGIHVRARPGPARDAFLDLLDELTDASQLPRRRLPIGATLDRLLGGLDLAATLQTGQPIFRAGLLVECNGGLLTVPMAERMGAETAAILSAAIDTGTVRVERDGKSENASSRFSMIALDEAAEPDETLPTSLRDRLALHVDLDGLSLADLMIDCADREDILAACTRLETVKTPNALLEVISGLALQMGIPSMRPVLFARRAATAHAALMERTEVIEEDVIAAVRLVLAPRAVVWPSPEPEQEQGEPPPPQEDDPNEPSETDRSPPDDLEEPMADQVLAAVAAMLPPDVLAKLKAAQATTRSGSSEGRAGAIQISKKRGRPAGVRPGDLGRGERLNVLETLRAAAPWQRLRGGGPGSGRLHVRKEDIRINRYKHRTETTTVFVVDASGSSALHRLAEIKGAVELLLAECYVRRDEVALIAFRQTTAEMILPPTRSLLRAKRQLAGLPGGGGTPLASGLEAAERLADGVRRKGRMPMVVVMTDGSANVGRDGQPGRAQAQDDAIQAARGLRAANVSTIWIDTAPRPQAQARKIADEMHALYLPLPRAGAAEVASTVDAAVTGRA